MTTTFQVHLLRSVFIHLMFTFFIFIEWYDSVHNVNESFTNPSENKQNEEWSKSMVMVTNRHELNRKCSTSTEKHK